MGAKHSSKITSGAHHVHRQEINRQPRRREESTYATTSALQSSSRTRSNASNMGSLSYTETSKTVSQWDGSNASSTGNSSGIGTCYESFPSSRPTSFGLRSDQASMITERLSRFGCQSVDSALDSSSKRGNSSGIGTCESFASSRPTNFSFRSDQASIITERLSRCGRQSVDSGLGSSKREEHSFSHRAHQANGHFQRPGLLEANFSGSGVSGAVDIQVNRQPVRMDHYNNVSFSLMQQSQWPGYWSPPSAAVFKISCAGIFSAPSQPAGFGAVIRTQEGSFLAALSGRLGPCEQDIIAEIIAIKEGLRLAAWMNLQEVEVRSSSLFVITELHKPGDSWLAYPYHQLLNEIKGMATTFRNCKFLHVRQEANSVALWLATYGFFFGTTQYSWSWFYAAPTFILPALQHDVNLGYT